MVEANPEPPTQEKVVISTTQDNQNQDTETQDQPAGRGRGGRGRRGGPPGSRGGGQGRGGQGNRGGRGGMQKKSYNEMFQNIQAQHQRKFGLGQTGETTTLTEDNLVESAS